MLVVGIVIAALLLVSVGLGIVQSRRETPLAYTCVRCGHEFQQAPHREFPKECPRCGATDWAAPRDDS